MFTSNDKIYCKRDSGNHLGSGLVELVGSQQDPSRGYNEDLLGRPRARAGHTAEPDVGRYDEPPGHFDRRLPPQSSGDRPGYEDGHEQRKVRFRNAGRKMSGQEVARDRTSRAFDEESSDSAASDSGYGGLLAFATAPQEYFRPETVLTPPEFLKPSSPEFAKSKSHGEQQSHGNQLLLLRAALNEKELQLVELREQHIAVLNRAADARLNWEEALLSKDRVILQLQKTLKHNTTQLDRQEKENQGNLHALWKRQKQENQEVERQELKVALLEVKNAQFVQELVEQQKLITRMKRHIEDKEKLCAKHYQKLEVMNGRIQELKSALQLKEDEFATQSKYCNELKSVLWKRDSMIAQLQLSEQQLQSALAREEAAREVQAMSQEKVQGEENSPTEKNQHKSLGNEASPNDHLEREHHQSELRDLNDREGVMHRIQKRMRELQRSLRSKDMALSDKNNEYQEALLEIQRLTEDYEAVKHEWEELYRRNYELENKVAHLQNPDRRMMGGASVSEAPTPPVEVLPYDCSLGGSTVEDLGFGDHAIQDSMEWEQLSNASVYHANFEKIKIVEVEMPDIDPEQQQQQHPATPIQPHHPSFKSPSPVRTRNPPTRSAATSPPRRPRLEADESPRSAPPPSAGPDINKDNEDLPSEFEAHYNSIQDEIKKREQCWRKTEELMREALTRRMKLLVESKEVQTPKTDVKFSTEAGLELHEPADHHHHHHHRQEASITRGYPDRKTRLELGSRVQCRKHSDNERCEQHMTPQRKALHHDGHKHGHGRDGAGVQRQAAYEQEVYQLDCRLNHDVGSFKKADSVHSRRRHQNAYLEADCTKPLEHYGHCERSGHHRRRGRVS